MIGVGWVQYYATPSRCSCPPLTTHHPPPPPPPPPPHTGICAKTSTPAPHRSSTSTTFGIDFLRTSKSGDRRRGGKSVSARPVQDSFRISCTCGCLSVRVSLNCAWLYLICSPSKPILEESVFTSSHIWASLRNLFHHIWLIWIFISKIYDFWNDKPRIDLRRPIYGLLCVTFFTIYD